MNHEHPTPQVPEFTTPEPTRLQRLSMGAATRLLGAGDAHPLVAVEKLVTEVGGYDVKPQLFPDASAPTQFTHKEAKQVVGGAAQDETTKQGHKMVYRNGGDFTDATGAYVESAFEATVSKRRSSGPKAGTMRGRAARSLMKYAAKGVGVQGHTRS